MYRIVRDPIDLEELRSVVRRGDGGVATFLGIVRGDSDGSREVTGLAYESYDRMALDEFAAIGDEARDRYGDVRVAVIHRVGELAVGEISVAVLAAAAHRAAAFDACRYVIDELKRRAPIWKKERYADGGSQWRATEQRA